MLTKRLLYVPLLALTVACGPAEPPGSADLSLRGAPAALEQPAELPTVVFLGDSLTAGLGVPPDQAFPALIQERIDQAALGFRVINAGVSGDTSAAGVRRIEWLLRESIQVLVLELGANDMLRGQDLGSMRANLQQIIDRTRARNPAVRIVIAGMRSVPNLGRRYAEAFAQTYVELARENEVALVPFLLDGVAAVPALNQADGLHPTAAGHRVIAENLWPVLESVLREARTGS